MTDNTMGAASSRHVGDLLSEYLHGDLPEGERREVETHLRECLRCSADLRTLRLTVQAVRRLPLDPVPRSFAIPTAIRPSTPVTSFLRWSTSILAAALVLFLAVGVVLPAVAPEYATRSSPATAPSAAPPLAPAVGPSNEVVQRAATAQAVGRATVTAMERSAATPAPAAPAPPQAAADAASGAPAAPPGGVAASAPAAAPASRAAAAPTNSPVASLAQGAATTSNSPSGQSPRPAAAAAPKSQGAVSTPVTGSYPFTPQPLVVPTPLPPGTYPADTGSGSLILPTASDSSPAQATPARPSAGASAPTTWFTPALGLLVLIAVVSAMAMSWFSRRGR